MSRFDGNILITGGSAGIGFATARLFLEAGARVAITGRDAGALAAAREQLGERLLTFQSDTSRLADIDALAASLKESLGSLDALFVNAGVAKMGPFEEVTEAVYDEILEINLKGAFFTIQRMLPLFVRGGAIVINSSVHANVGIPNGATYAASKGGLVSLARSLAAELLPRNIRVNTVIPGPIATDISARNGDAPGTMEARRKRNPMKRLGAPEDVARAVFFLTTSASSYITGAEIPVDGGLLKLIG
jgi:NAD(P)-dependent dehydrogenase (short-subunit alcohol dehydrogenase family)